MKLLKLQVPIKKCFSAPLETYHEYFLEKNWNQNNLPNNPRKTKHVQGTLVNVKNFFIGSIMTIRHNKHAITTFNRKKPVTRWRANLGGHNGSFPLSGSIGGHRYRASARSDYAKHQNR